MAKLGRKTKYCPEIVEKILGYLRRGATQEDAAIMSDIDRATFLRWKNKYAIFATAIKKAQSDSKQKMIDIVRAKAPTTWQAGAWWLERRHRGQYAVRQDVRVSGQVKVEILPSFVNKKKKAKKTYKSKKKMVDIE